MRTSKGFTDLRGFTLLEVLVALFILTGAIIVIANAWSGNFMRMRKTSMYNNVATLLERKMVEVEAKYRDKPINEIPESEEGDFENDFPQYRWEMKSRDLELPDLTALIVGQGEGADEQLITLIKQMSEFISDAVKEVKVSIYVKSASGKEVEFSATQYFVDYTKQFGGGLPGAAGGP